MNPLSRFNNIRFFVFDVDGVLTDGTVLVLENGLQARRMSIRDGFALQLAVKRGYGIKVISGSNASPVVDRLNKLGISDITMGVLDKGKLLEQFMKDHKIAAETLLYMGDDLPDIPAMKLAGLAACPSDAAHEIRELAHYISPFSGGKACVRDVIEKVLKLRGHWGYESDVASS